jgi:MFS family permease
VRPVFVGERFELAQDVKQVPLVPAVPVSRGKRIGIVGGVFAAMLGVAGIGSYNIYTSLEDGGSGPRPVSVTTPVSAPVDTVSLTRKEITDTAEAFLLGDSGLRDTAAQFGLTQQWSVGTPAHQPDVPGGGGPDEMTSEMIGHGQLRLSPLIMASVAATASTGHFRQPLIVAKSLIDGPVATADDLPPGISGYLREMMHGAITTGTAHNVMSGFGTDSGAKTGSAEIDGQDTTNGWFTAFGGHVAAAAVVHDAGHGNTSRTPAMGRGHVRLLKLPIDGIYQSSLLPRMTTAWQPCGAVATGVRRIMVRCRSSAGSPMSPAPAVGGRGSRCRATSIGNLMRSFWLLTFATAISMAGNTFLYLAVPWALMESTGSSLLAVLSMAAQTAPYLAAPFFGAFMDRHDNRSLFLAGEVVQCVSVALIPLLLAVHQIVLVFVSLCVMGLAKVVSDVAGDYGLIPALVPKDRIDQASSWYNSVQMAARFAGPALAGLTIAAVGPSWALEIDAATFLVTMVTALFLPKAVERIEQIRTSAGQLFKEGIAYFRSRPDMQRLTAAVALYNLGAGALEPTLLTVGTQQWRWSESAMGVAISFGAVAGAAGAWASPRIPGGDERRSQRVGIWLGVAALGSLGLLIGSPMAVVIGFCVLCFGEGGVNSTTMAYRQHEIPPEFSGRVNTVIRMFITGAVPVSSLLLGLTVGLTGSWRVFFPVTVTALLAVFMWTSVGGRRRRRETENQLVTGVTNTTVTEGATR